MTAPQRDIVRDERSKFEFHDDVVYLKQTKRGLTRDTVEEISAFKEEPAWMHEYRLRAYDHFLKRPMPAWGGDLSKIDFDKIVYYRKPSEREEKSWDDVPDQIKKTFEKLGIPEAERKFLAGVGAQYDSEVVYHSVREELTKLGVVFMGTDQGLEGTSGDLPEVLRHGRPGRGQQVLRPQCRGLVGRLVRLRAQGRGRAAAAAGLFPHQRREHRASSSARSSSSTRAHPCTISRDACRRASWSASATRWSPSRPFAPGTTVMNSAGVEAPVSAARRRSYAGAMLKIVPVSVGNAFELTPEHPVWTIRRERVADARPPHAARQPVGRGRRRTPDARSPSGCRPAS